MLRVFRLICIWCLALVLPLQGLAAGCLMNCAGQHLPAAVATVAAAEPEVGAPPCHAAADTQAAPSANGLDESAVPDAGHRCSACAACGLAPALPAAAPVLGQPEAVRESGTRVSVRLASVAVAGLERPPRAAA